MINRVLLAGRIVDDPKVTTTESGNKLTVLTLRVQHPSWISDTPEDCAVEVQMWGEGRASVAERYFKSGMDLMVEGRLLQDGARLVVALERFHFMLDGVQPRYFWHEAFKQTAAA